MRRSRSPPGWGPEGVREGPEISPESSPIGGLATRRLQHAGMHLPGVAAGSRRSSRASVSSRHSTRSTPRSTMRGSGPSRVEQGTIQDISAQEVFTYHKETGNWVHSGAYQKTLLYQSPNVGSAMSAAARRGSISRERRGSIESRGGPASGNLMQRRDSGVGDMPLALTAKEAFADKARQ